MCTLLFRLRSPWGDLPFLRLSDDMAIFRSIRFRGTVRIGRYIVACDPRIAVKSAMGVVDRFLYRKGVTARPIFQPGAVRDRAAVGPERPALHRAGSATCR